MSITYKWRFILLNTYTIVFLSAPFVCQVYRSGFIMPAASIITNNCATVMLWTQFYNVVHCKYVQCNFYTFYRCPTFHCNPTVLFTSDCCSKYSDLQWFTVTSTLLHCNVYGKYFLHFFMNVPVSTVYICSVCKVSNDAYNCDRLLIL